MRFFKVTLRLPPRFGTKYESQIKVDISIRNLKLRYSTKLLQPHFSNRWVHYEAISKVFLNHIYESDGHFRLE